ncbi:hypothetical protein [Plantactinospora sp. KLBMP9567]|uniref:hypothetical protein n=1 Tax=Plantactinospora sp. KLBMP9567 TaxID=3085900 RepID=UPI002981502B|nr:hypothetical protein [Plantactinospora sp. KLBMP9567]MDW5324545.1 hypothetical protein [Plantactinospora sp. KLBMP9567]
MSLYVVHVVGMSVSAVVLLLVAVTRFGTTSVVDRALCGLGALAAGGYAYYLAFQFEGGPYTFFLGALLVPLYAGYKLYTGFRRRDLDRAQRQAAKAAQQAADEWRSTRRW